MSATQHIGIAVSEHSHVVIPIRSTHARKPSDIEVWEKIYNALGIDCDYINLLPVSQEETVREMISIALADNGQWAEPYTLIHEFLMEPWADKKWSQAEYDHYNAPEPTPEPSTAMEPEPIEVEASILPCGSIVERPARQVEVEVVEPENLNRYDAASVIHALHLLHVDSKLSEAGVVWSEPDLDRPDLKQWGGRYYAHRRQWFWEPVDVSTAPMVKAKPYDFYRSKSIAA